MEGNYMSKSLPKAKTLWLKTAIVGIAVLLATAATPPPTINEYPVPSGLDNPTGITAGSDGALWFTEYNGKIGRITTAGVVTNEYPVPPTNGSIVGIQGITEGSDGALWFTEINWNKIGRITTAGVVTNEYPVPTANSGPVWITAGSDGALWFTEDSGNQIGRITTAGVITEYALPTANSSPIGIAAGPDGALWFTEAGSNKIGRITTAGVITEYPVPTGGSDSQVITTGPDGALWFTEYGSNKIGRITTGGAVTEYPVPTAGFPDGITAGPDGALWFTEISSDKIGRITTAGAVTDYAVPNSSPIGITAGPDGALWFADDNGRIGQVVLGFNPAAKNQAQQEAPIKLGTSGSNINDAACCGTGTLGSLVKDGSGNTYILGANHVLARSNQGQLGESIIQRGFLDTAPRLPACSAGTGTIAVAKLSSYVPLVFGGSVSNYVDAAIAQTLAGSVDPAGGILEIGTISTATVTPKLNMHVEKAGRKTGLTVGSIDTLNFTILIDYSPCGSTSVQTAKFVGQFRILPFNTFGRASDSGSLIVKKVAAGSGPNPVGLLFASDPTGRIVANPINTVLTKLGADLGSSLSFVGTAASGAEVASLAAERPEPEVEAVSLVKDRYDDFLLSLPEAVGHGVSYSNTGSGRVVIRLFLKRMTDAALRAAPTSLEGVPVEVEETGEYHAIQACASVGKTATIKK
jgi:virginiamycin B lyase